MKEFIGELFSSKWRWSRSKFNISMLIITIIPFIVMWTILFILFRSWELNILNLLAFDFWSIDNIYFYISIVWFIGILFIFITLFAFIKRLHDLNLSWFFFFIAIIPTVNILFTLYLSLFKWTKWENKFWPDPLGWTNENTNNIPNEL